MSSTELKSPARRSVQLLRILLVINFVLLLALIGPGNSRELYLAERKMGLAQIITQSLQLWFVGSTVVVTALFIRLSVLRSKMLLVSQSPTKLDWALFLSWWFVVAICCMLAFIMGMGG